VSRPLVRELGFETARFFITRPYRAHEALTRIGVQIAARLGSSEQGIAQRFRGLVGLFAGPVRVEAQLPLVEDVLRGLAGLVDPLLDLIPDCHGVLA